MEVILQWLRDDVLTSQTYKAIGLTIAIPLLFWLLRKLFLRFVLPRIEDVYLRFQVQKISGYVAVGMAVVLISPLWIGGLKNAATYFGLLSAGVAIALQELFINFAAWVFIVWRRPFVIGDRIQIGDQAGDVIDIRIFQFSLIEIGNWVDADQSTGRIIHLPNGKVFRDVLANYSTGFYFIWNEIPVLITFESNWKKAKEVLSEIADRHGNQITQAAEEQLRNASKKFLIFYTKLTPIVYTSVKDSGVLFTIRYICEPRKRRNSTQMIWEDILTQFADCDDIDLAYPTQRFYNNITEGKPDNKPR